MMVRMLTINDLLPTMRGGGLVLQLKTMSLAK